MIFQTKYNNEYNNSLNKFTMLKDGVFDDKLNRNVNLHYFVNKSDTNYIEPEWEFPKGRKNNGESNKMCAIREFTEETNYNKDDYELIINIKPLTEFYIGENKIKYTHVYYIGYLKNTEKQLQVDTSNLSQCLEVSDLKWFTQTECLNKIRKYHKSRKKVIDDIFTFLNDGGKYNLI